MSLDRIHDELLDYVNTIYLMTHKEPGNIQNFLLSISGTARPFLVSFMKIYGYDNKDYLNIMINISNLSKVNSYSVNDSDYLTCVNLGIIPDGKEELDQTVNLDEN